MNESKIVLLKEDEIESFWSSNIQPIILSIFMGVGIGCSGLFVIFLCLSQPQKIQFILEFVDILTRLGLMH